MPESGYNIFAKNCMKMKTIGLGGGLQGTRAPLSPRSIMWKIFAANTLKRFDTFKAKLIFFRITSCVQRSLHPEQESTIFYGGHQPN